MNAAATPDALRPRARKQLEREIAEALGKHDPVVSHGKRKHSVWNEELRATLSKCSDQTLYRVQHTEKIPDMRFGIFSLILNESIPEEVINDWCMLYPTINPVMLERELMQHLYALPYYEHLDPQLSGHYSERRAAQGTAIIRVTKHLKQRGVRTSMPEPSNGNRTIEFIKEKKLRDLLTSSENPSLLADLIIERNLTTAAQVREMINNIGGLPAVLTEGAL
jgi:hypothetical protein